MPKPMQGRVRIEERGAFGRVLDLKTRFDPLHLNGLLPDAQGTLTGELALRGDPSAPAIDGHLQGSALRWRSYGAAHLLLDGKLKAHEDGTLQIEADGIVGIPTVDAAKLRVAGSEQKPRVVGAISGTIGAITLDVSAEHQDAAWNGRIASLHYAPTHGAAWTLSSPATFRFDGKDAVRLQSTCMHSDGASICADADWPRSANLRTHALPLNLLDAWIARPDLNLRAYGTVDTEAHLAPAHSGWTGTAQLHSSEGGLQLQPELARPLFGYTNLVAHAHLDGERLQLRRDS